MSGLLLLAAFGALRAQKPTSKLSCSHGVNINTGFSKAAALQSVMDRFTQKELPGISLALYSESEGWWAGASGYARIEDKTPMTTCHLQYLQSVAKTYMAVAILQLYEKGKIDLNASMTKYLPSKYSTCIKHAERITIKMLLNHTSGIAEYISLPRYTEAVILTPQKVISMDWAIELLKKEEPQFTTGAEYRYTNTNYLILAMIAEEVTGNHARYIQEHIFRPLQMNNSYYQPANQTPHYSSLPDSYWDILNAGRPANITPMQRANVAPLKGDDGVISTPIDAVKFLSGLMAGKLMSDSSLKLMQEWVNRDGKPVYGLGLIRFDFNGIVAYGHGGGGLGAGCVLLYIPSQKLYLFIASNTGVVIDGLGGIKANEMKDQILSLLL